MKTKDAAREAFEEWRSIWEELIFLNDEDIAISQQAYMDGHQAATQANREALGEVLEALKDAQLWIDEMQVGVNKWAGDSVGLIARQQNLTAFRNGDCAKAIAKIKQLIGDE